MCHLFEIAQKGPYNIKSGIKMKGHLVMMATTHEGLLRVKI